MFQYLPVWTYISSCEIRSQHVLIANFVGVAKFHSVCSIIYTQVIPLGRVTAVDNVPSMAITLLAFLLLMGNQRQLIE